MSDRLGEDQVREAWPSDDEEVGTFLERDQFVADKSTPLPRARLGAGAQAALWTLRVFAVLLAAVVLYTFASHLG